MRELRTLNFHLWLFFVGRFRIFVVGTIIKKHHHNEKERLTLCLDYFVVHGVLWLDGAEHPDQFDCRLELDQLTALRGDVA